MPDPITTDVLDRRLIVATQAGLPLVPRPYHVIAEELGFRGALLLLFGFALLLIQGLFIAFYSRDVAGRLIACMVVALFFAHIFENIGMCVLLMPITGIPLPLVSYSGTFVVICMFLPMFGMGELAGKQG